MSEDEFDLSSADEAVMLELETMTAAKRRACELTDEASIAKRSRVECQALVTATKVLKEHFALKDFRLKQAAAIERLLQGGGKSLCYQVPAVSFKELDRLGNARPTSESGITIVVSPLIALMKDQVDSLKRRGISAAVLDSTRTREEYLETVASMRNGTLDIVYCAPERLNNEGFVASMAHVRGGVRLLAVDEAHCISEWGHAFRPDYLKVARFAQEIQAERVVCLTATATPAVAKDICNAFNVPDEGLFRTTTYRPNLRLLADSFHTKAQAYQNVCAFLKVHPGPTIIYVTLQKQTEDLARRLSDEGFTTRSFHAGMKPAEKSDCQDAFMISDKLIIVATIAFGMGIDKANIRNVIHYDLPRSLEGYSQEIGRAGRDGRLSHCLLYLCAEDLHLRESFARGDLPSKTSVSNLLREVFGSQPRDGVVEASTLQQSKQYDIRPTVLGNIYAQLELRFRLLRATTPKYTSYTYKHIRSTEYDRSPAAEAIRTYSKKASIWTSLNMEAALESGSASRNEIVVKLNHWNDSGQIELKTGGVVNIYRVLKPLPATDSEQQAIIDLLYQELVVRESQDLERMHQVSKLVTNSRCLARCLAEHFGDSLPNGTSECGHCTWCETQKPVPNVAPEPAAWNSQAFLAVLDAVSDRDDARYLARVAFGISSPRVTASKVNGLKIFGSMDDHDFVAFEEACEKAGMVNRPPRGFENSPVGTDNTHDHKPLGRSVGLAMPSTSPGDKYVQILPGAPRPSLQCVTTFVYRQKRYIAYISGCQLNILTGPATFVQALTFRSELSAVLADGSTGSIALIVGKSNTYILEPRTEGWSKVWWVETLSLRREDRQDEAKCLSWGSEGEILVGGSRHLSLYSTSPASRTASQEISQPDGELLPERRSLWSKAVASSVSQAIFSPSGGLIATTGSRDKLVKIWRRLSFEEALFDFCYLPHGGVVTHVEWRPLDQHTEERRGSGISARHDEDPEVLYTIASDGILRVWRTGGLHDLEIVALLTSMDLVGAIPQSPSLSSKRKTASPARYACILGFDTFSHAVTSSIARQLGNTQVSHSLEHLKEVITKSPDVVLELDGQGRMSAWGLQSIGHKRRPEDSDVNVSFHVAHAEGLGLQITENTNATLTAWFEDDMFNLIVHDFIGGISWWRGGIDTFFSPGAATEKRLKLIATWHGQAANIKDIQYCHENSDLVSWTVNREPTYWTVTGDGIQLTMSSRKIKLPSKDDSSPAEGYQTGMSNPGITIANIDLVAMSSSDGKDLVMLERKDSYVEHRRMLGEEVKHLAFFSSAPQHNFLAVSYDTHVEVFIQDRYKQQHNGHSNAWMHIKTVSVQGLGLDIEALEWLSDGRLALAVGNGMLITNNEVFPADLPLELRESLNLDGEEGQVVTLPSLASRLRQDLPMWHPELLRYMIYHGRINAAAGLLHNLLARLKFWSEGDELQIVADANVQTLIDNSQFCESVKFNRDLIDELLEQLTIKNLPMLSSSEQHKLKGVIETIAYICENAHGLDVFAVRYLFEWKTQVLGVSVGDSNTSPGKDFVPQMQWRDIAFAYHSKTQQALIDILILHHDNKITWSIARSLGLTAWIVDREALATVFEALAQSAYRASDPPDPTNASLYFLASHKKTTLLALWRIATWHKEQRATINFLKRNFEAPDAKTAAKKNAYALMGKRRFDYAAAFFLLADDPVSAVGVLASQCEDIMLAVAVARLYGTGIKKLVLDRLLPQALQSKDRWYTTWCHAIISQPREAAYVLVKPLEGVVMWWQDDPLTLLLYKELRKTAPSEVDEYAAVMRATRILRRMGLSLMALDLVKNWMFAQAPTSISREDKASTADLNNGVLHAEGSSGQSSVLDTFISPGSQEPNTKQAPPSFLDPFTTQAPVVDEKAAREAKAAELLAKLRAKKSTVNNADDAKRDTPKREPTQFKEPDTNSLLDNFGF
nr:atp-dependent dna helicase recq [Quercus suber]